MKRRSLSSLILLGSIGCGLCLPDRIGAADNRAATLDPKSGSILGSTLGMSEKQVKSALRAVLRPLGLV